MAILTAPSDRLKGALVAGAVQALIGWALVTGLLVSASRAPDERLKLFDLVERPPPIEKEVVPPEKRASEAEGRAAPPNISSEATEIVAPPPIVPLPVPPPVTTAPVAGPGTQPTQGAADVPGPGQGAGGQGDGFGGGGAGRGRGGGGRDDRDDTPPELIRGRIGIGDLPEHLRESGNGGAVRVRYMVETDGRVSGCRVTRSSGTPELDRLTCRLIEQRFRFDPSRDASGRPVISQVVERHDWAIEDEPEEPEPRPRRRRFGF